MLQIWPAILVSGLSFAIPQFIVSNYIGPELVDVIAAISSMACLVVFLRFWKPKALWTSTSLKGHLAELALAAPARPPAMPTGPVLATSLPGAPVLGMTAAALQAAPRATTATRAGAQASANTVVA